MSTTKYVQDYVTTKYPKAEYLKTLKGESFDSWIYEKAPFAFLCLKQLGSSWATSLEDVENSIRELLDHALKSLKKDSKEATWVSSGMLRVELTITSDWEDSGEKIVHPELLIEL